MTDQAPLADGRIGVRHAGRWECGLTNEPLIWFGGFEITRVSHVEIFPFYREARGQPWSGFKLTMKRRRGFTLDPQVRAVTGETRSITVIVAPMCEGTQVIRRTALKLIILMAAAAPITDVTAGRQKPFVNRSLGAFSPTGRDIESRPVGSASTGLFG